IPHSNSAIKTKDCNILGNGYVYGTCVLETCASGYHALANTCVVDFCKANQPSRSVNCTSEIPHAQRAEKTKTCNAAGTDYIYGNCQLDHCLTGYYQDGNSCKADACVPKRNLGTVDCHSEILNSTKATRAKSCNSTGSDYAYGSCKLEKCADGYSA